MNAGKLITYFFLILNNILMIDFYRPISDNTKDKFLLCGKTERTSPHKTWLYMGIIIQEKDQHNNWRLNNDRNYFALIDFDMENWDILFNETIRIEHCESDLETSGYQTVVGHYKVDPQEEMPLVFSMWDIQIKLTNVVYDADSEGHIFADVANAGMNYYPEYQNIKCQFVDAEEQLNFLYAILDELQFTVDDANKWFLKD